jgi:transcriptional regulator with XRE-family HTH domain
VETGSGLETIGQAVRSRRELFGLSQKALGAATGYTPGMIAQIEQGKVLPSFPQALRLAHYLGIDLNHLSGVVPLEAPREEWFSEVFLLRLPGSVQRLWPGVVQQRALLNALQAMLTTLALEGPLPNGDAERS